MAEWETKQRHHCPELCTTEPQLTVLRWIRWPVWLFLSVFARVQQVWAARSTSFRGQWSLGSLIGSLVILGILAALVVFFIWPRQGGQ